MSQKSYEELYAQLNAALSGLLLSHADPVKLLAEALQLIQQALKKLRKQALSAPFANVLQEIHFFKCIKPKFYALKIFHFERYSLDMAKPVGTKEMLQGFYQQELLQLQRFFGLQAFWYQYYRTGSVEMDNFYFKRGAEVPSVLLPELPEADPEFSTAMDYLFAKFMAYELLQTEILKRMAVLEGASVIPGLKAKSALRWTGSQVNMVELIYGLYYTGQLNNGAAEIVDIVKMMEEVFRFKLTDAHHSFIEIRNRKVSSPTRFLEQLVAAIRQRVEEDLEYKPNRGVKLRKGFNDG